VAYSPLGRGFLSGRIQSPAEIPEDDRKRQHPRFQGENFDHNRQLVGRIEAIAREKGVTPAQLALAWLLAQGDDVVPIPGTKRIAYLEENFGALGVQLSAGDLQRIDEALPAGAAKGGRYPDAQLRGVYL
jgi:aryl-alcohol dehydrogenase-like predicted oxidoreductase